MRLKLRLSVKVICESGQGELDSRTRYDAATHVVVLDPISRDFEQIFLLLHLYASTQWALAAPIELRQLAIAGAYKGDEVQVDGGIG